MKVLVTGGTGLLGREVMARLRSPGGDGSRAPSPHDVRVLTRGPANAPGIVSGDLERAGDTGVAAAVAGIEVVVHCASAADWVHPQRDVTQTRNLLAALTGTSTHVVYISIVGVDGVRFGYYRAKLACEELVEHSGLPWTILRATQFHDLVRAFASALSRGPVALAPRGIVLQPVDVGLVADRLVALAAGTPAGRARDVGGPEARSIEEFFHLYFSISGRRRPMLRFPLPGKAGADLRAGHQLLGPDGERGGGTFADHLRAYLAAR